MVNNNDKKNNPNQIVNAKIIRSGLSSSGSSGSSSEGTTTSFTDGLTGRDVAHSALLVKTESGNNYVVEHTKDPKTGKGISLCNKVEVKVIEPYNRFLIKKECDWITTTDKETGEKRKWASQRQGNSPVNERATPNSLRDAMQKISGGEYNLWDKNCHNIRERTEKEHLYKSENYSLTTYTKETETSRTTSNNANSIIDNKSIQIETPSSSSWVRTSSRQHESNRVNFSVSQEGFQAHTEVATFGVRPNNGGVSVSVSIPIACKIM